MRTLVEESVAETLRAEGGETVRLYAAACAERMAPLFVGLQAGGAGREADLDFFVESVRGLWYADRPLPDVSARVRALERFPELQPNEEGISDIAGTYTFFAALVLRHALLANRSGIADDAVSCGHAALTATGMLDQNLGGAAYRAQEERLQLLSVSGDVAGLWEASVEAGRERFRAVLGRTARSSG
ncbi:hypothetical protein OG562_39380 [Streptomyces sp. NBC_01275]|uniref:hypothetical protein n=1 Tax=Streptomyces sp. NBC_01275 TaxID=2903807 RepID=UPI00224E6185|nr:hypothetical protein [Streptomyces sp. NBC_01275]MCX4766930.1 hypothetical protein [Streptomyces sp. NBC_01275]